LITSQVKRKLIQLQHIQHLDFLESELRESLRFANDQFTAADIQMSFPVEVAVVRADLNVSPRKLMKFLDLIHARPVYQRVLERGGMYGLAS
jgi:glutathione S-transferase